MIGKGSKIVFGMEFLYSMKIISSMLCQARGSGAETTSMGIYARQIYMSQKNPQRL